MKKISNLLMILFFAFAFPTFALAEEVNVDSESTLNTCVATTGNTCKITSNIELNHVIEINGNVIIDLNGNTIIASNTLTASSGVIIVHNGASLTVNDSVGTGVISSGTTGTVYGGIQLTKRDDDSTNTAVLVVNAGTIEGYYYGIVGNGTRPNTSITINNGNIKGLAADSIGIFNPQNGNIIINNGTVTGGTGIEMRAGSLTVNDGFIIATSTTFSIAPNGNGSTTVGAGIAVSQHTTAQLLSVTVNDGTVKGIVALNQQNIQNNSTEDVNKITLNVAGGTFEAINGGTTAINSENKIKFVTGGSVNTTLDANYIKDNYSTVPVNGFDTVVTNHDVTIAPVTNGSVSVDVNNALINTDINVTVTPDTDYEIDTLVLKNNVTNTETAIVNNTFKMLNNDVTVKATFKKIERDIVVVTTTNGTVITDKTEATTGETVKVTTTPSTGYELDELTVTNDTTDELVTITNGEFVMPSSEVTVKATFKEIENPKTGDGIMNSIILTSLSIISIAICGIYLNKKSFN